MSTKAGRTLNVLIVDDDDADAMMIEEALENADAGVSVHRVSDGREAIEYLRGCGDDPPNQRPDLILLDLNMPRMGGQETLSVIKEDDTLRAIPVVILTTSGAHADILASYQHRANAYVTKPMELDQFERAVAEINRFYRDVALLPR